MKKYSWEVKNEENSQSKVLDQIDQLEFDLEVLKNKKIRKVEYVNNQEIINKTKKERETQSIEGMVKHCINTKN